MRRRRPSGSGACSEKRMNSPVSVADGATTLTRTASGACSIAACLHRFTSAPLLAQYAGWPGATMSPRVEPIAITDPPPWAAIRGIAARMQRNGPFRFTSRRCCHSSSEQSSTVRTLSIAADRTRTVRGPRVSATRTAARSPPAVMASATRWAPGPSMSATTTAAPSDASRCAMASPSPLAPPVTIADPVSVTGTPPGPRRRGSPRRSRTPTGRWRGTGRSPRRRRRRRAAGPGWSG